jgi:hypothetical protein
MLSIEVFSVPIIAVLVHAQTRANACWVHSMKLRSAYTTATEDPQITGYKANTYKVVIASQWLVREGKECKYIACTVDTGREKESKHRRGYSPRMPILGTRALPIPTDSAFEAFCDHA